jgi:ribonuclease HI
MGRIIVYVDGLCEPVNPGGVGCYGFVVVRDGRTVMRGRGVAGSGRGMTNNVAEYSAAIAALTRLLEEGVHDSPDGVEVRSDSQLLVRQMQGVYAVRSPRIRQLHGELRALTGCFPSVSWKWIPRRLNEEADNLSRQAYAEHLAQAARERAAGLRVEPLQGGRWRVLSSRGHRWYTVTLDPDSCTCPAFERGARPCKHIVAARMHALSGGGLRPEGAARPPLREE